MPLRLLEIIIPESNNPHSAPLRRKFKNYSSHFEPKIG